MMRHEFHPEALAEYEDAARFYAARQPDLDLRFIAVVEDAIAAVCEDPQRYRSFDGGEIRRALTRLSLRHSLQHRARLVLVVAVAHCSREPGYWRDRLT